MRKIFNYFALMIVMLLIALIVCGCSESSGGGVADGSEKYGGNDFVDTSTVDSINKNDTENSTPSSAYPPTTENSTPPAVQTDERDYEIMYNYELDKCYFVFYDPTPYENRTGGMITAHLDFPSIEEFLDKVLNGKLKSYEKSHLAEAFQKSEIGYEICDLKNMYYPVLPEGIEVGGFSWYGKKYSFSIYTSEGKHAGSVSVFDEESLNVVYERYYENASPPKGGNVVSKTIDGTNIIGRYFYSRLGELYSIQYELQTEEKRVFVEKRYYNGQSQPYVTLYCFEGDKFYEVKLNELASELDKDLLLSFSIESYIQNNG